jgi:Holliday junction resolvase
MKDKYGFGRKNEQAVAQSLRRKGASVNVSPGSRGPADLRAESENTTWLVQVKASESDCAAMPSPKERGDLKRKATREGATPVIARKTPEGTKYTSARTGRELSPPKGKK